MIPAHPGRQIALEAETFLELCQIFDADGLSFSQVRRRMSMPLFILRFLRAQPKIVIAEIEQKRQCNLNLLVLSLVSPRELFDRDLQSGDYLQPREVRAETR